MTRFNIIILYLILSAINGVIPLLIALALSVPGMIALVIWGLATLASFIIICLVCLGNAMKDAIPEPELHHLGSEFEKFAL